MRITEERARQLGLVCDQLGNWHDGNKRIQANLQTGNPRPLPKPESNIRNESKKKNDNKKETKRASRETYKIIVIARKIRGVDPDNLAPKYFIDEIVRAGIIPDDSSKYIESIEKRVEKVKTKEEEKTIIEIYKEGATK